MLRRPERLPPLRLLRPATLCLLLLALFWFTSNPALGAVPQTPYMGVDTWYAVGTQVNESVVTSMANAMVADGLVAAGYNILWLDSGWWNGIRDTNGNIVVSPAQWPHGMSWLTAYLHARGIRAGIYTDAGDTGCTIPGAGSYGHYQADVNQFAAWGFDAVKVDFCGGDRMGLDPVVAYRQFGAAIQNDSPRRPMLFNVCDGFPPDRFGPGNPPYDESAWTAYSFDPAASSWRTNSDIGAPGFVDFSGVLANLDWDSMHPFAAGHGHWNDPDYIVPDEGMTQPEAQAQFSMWAILAAPLMLSNNILTMPFQTLQMVTDRLAIAIDQDRLGIQGWLVARYGNMDVWVRPLAGGARAVALLNRAPTPALVSVTLASLGFPQPKLKPVAKHKPRPKPPRYQVLDIWTQVSRTVTTVIRRSVPADSAFLLRVAPE